MASTAVSPQTAPAKDSVGVDVNDKATPVKRKAQPVSYWSLFRFADRIDVALFVVGIIANLGNGIIFPMFSFIFAGLLDSFFDQGSAVAQIDKYAGYLAIIAAGTLVCSFFGLGGILWSAERQGSRLRKAYLRALLRAEVGYHDTNHTAEAVSRMSEDVSVMLKGIGEPFANTIQFGTQFVAGLIMGFVRGPKLAAVVCCFLPLLALCAAGMKVLLGKIQKLEADAYARAGEIATESISNIRSVASNCGEEAEVRRYDRHLSQAERMGRFKGLATGLSMGGIWFSILSCYGVGLWYGSTLIVDSRQADPGCEIDPLKAGCFTGGSVINVFFAVIIAAFAIAQAAPNLSAFGTACGAAATIYDLIDRVPEIDNLSEGGLKPDPGSVRGRVEFRNVTFAYPSRPTATVLRGFSLVIEAGHTVALVGPSGCGKSSVIALLQRWYDPQGGSITLDGVDLREYNVQWLRERMGLVLQDPVLFQASVAENIALGLPEVASGAQTGADGSSAAVGADTLRALQPRIEAAARAANAHDFILRDLADGYSTYVGEKGGQMSGGQRQRVCIARALIRSPAIMLLDEATSALDTRSERIVQAAIDRLLSGEADAELARSGGAAAAAGLRASRTSVCIAHRLSTIRGATSIVVMEGGSITAQGTHEQLMGVEGGLYRTMVEQQALGSGGGHAGARKRRAGSAASGARASATGAGVGSGLAAAAAVVSASADESGEESGDEEDEGEGGEAAPASSLAPAGDHTAIVVKGTDPDAIARAVSARSAASARSRNHTHASIGSPEGSGVAPEVNMLASVMAVPLPVRRPSTVGGPAAGEGDGEAGEVAMVTSTNANPLFAYTTPSTHPADAAAAPAAGGDAIQHRGSSAVRRGASSAQRKAAAAAATEATATAPAAAAAADAGGKGKGKDGKDKKAAEPDLPAVPFKRVFAYQRPELWHMLLATLSAGVAGAAMPSFSILFSRMTNVFYSSTADIEQNTAAYCGYFILIGVVCFFGQLGMWGLFAYAGEKLTRRLRVATYKAVLTQEVAYFDDQANTTGRITARLSEEAALVKATTGEKLALATQSICSLITGLVIAFVASWRVALLVLAVFPLIALVGAAQVKLLAGMSAVKESEEAGNIVLEATSSIRTVYAFGLQNLLLARFAAALRPMEEKGFRRSWMTGAGMGAAMAVLFGSYALVFWAGGRFVNNGWLSFQDMLQAFFAIIMAAQGAGQASGLATDAGKAEKAKRSIFALLDRRSAINPLSEGGERPSRIAGTVEFRDVGFAYPARPGQPVLRGLNVTVRAGQTLALVGPSGSGKSTLIALLQRCYDPASGSVLLDGRDIREYPPHFLRGVQALVPQMPALWGDAVEYNIAYGRLPHTIPEPDAGVAVDAGPGAIVPATFKHDPTVEASARSANAHDFIAGFPHGYATHVGAGGSGLSGGQRSRVAIARAIHRNPRIVLLDEATAALDSESERIVQAALDNLLSIAGSGRPGSGAAGEDEEASSAMTKIVVAHRLATIRHADIIAVVNDGRVVEQGTHGELMQRGGGLYRQLALAQDPSAGEGYAITAAAAPAPAATA